jgi:hypothetical protein
MRQINDTALLVTVAEDLSNEPILKVWALDTEKKDGGPRCLSTVSVQNARRQFPVRFNCNKINGDHAYTGIDFCFYSHRRPLASSNRLRERIRDHHPRRPDPRSRRTTTNRI